MATKFIRWIPALLLAAALPVAAQAGDVDAAVAKQVSTASAHAGMAVGATDLATAHAHLHHVINCLVGPDGKAYDAKEENPCKGMGQGAIADAKGNSASETKLHAALARAEQGAKAGTLSAAQADAKQVMKALQAK